MFVIDKYKKYVKVSPNYTVFVVHNAVRSEKRWKRARACPRWAEQSHAYIAHALPETKLQFDFRDIILK